jgi:hypothetical protein
MRKRLLLTFALLAAVAIVAIGAVLVLVWIDSTRPGVTLANFNRIENGMTLTEVDGLLGPSTFGICASASDLINDPVYVWVSPDRDQASITFANGRVSETRWVDSEASTWDRLRRRFEWLLGPKRPVPRFPVAGTVVHGEAITPPTP